MGIEKIIEEKRRRREWVVDQVKNFCEKNDFIKTLSQGKPAVIKEITSDSVTVIPSEGKEGNPPTPRKIKFSKISDVYKVLCQKKEIRMVDSRSSGEFATSYIMALIGNFEDVEYCSTKSEVLLRLKE